MSLFTGEISTFGERLARKNSEMVDFPDPGSSDVQPARVAGSLVIGHWSLVIREEQAERGAYSR
jgi:hypothetical protein